MRNKKQHTVPRTYLQNFADGAGKVHILRGNSIYSSRPEAVLTENHFYTVRLASGGASFVVEDTLSALEGQFSQVFRETIGRKAMPNVDERATVAIFIAAMLMRTRSHRSMLSGFFDRVATQVARIEALPEESKQILNSMPVPGRTAVPADEFLALGEDLNTLQATLLMQNLARIAQLIFAMKWTYINAKAGTFITSDNPVCMVNPQLENEYGAGRMASSPGLGQPGVEVTMPLGSSIAFIAGWKLQREGYVTVDQAFVDNFNMRSMRSSLNEIVASDKSLLERLKERAGPVRSSPSADESR